VYLSLAHGQNATFRKPRNHSKDRLSIHLRHVANGLDGRVAVLAFVIGPVGKSEEHKTFG
jgi:hypothetical protein